VEEIKKDITASVRARLLNYARMHNLGFDGLLLTYFQERLLYRISISKYSKKFILKGGLLIFCYNLSYFRPTKDIDFLAKNIKNNRKMLRSIFLDIINIKCEDGVLFDNNSIEFELIKENFDYQGLRIKIKAYLGKANKVIQIDIGFGDDVSNIEDFDFPVIINMPFPHIQVYPKEYVIAEKFDAMVTLEMLNSRMKDFFDIYNFLITYKFQGNQLLMAIKKTFNKRKTSLEKYPVIFNEECYKDNTKNIQWNAFIKKLNITSEIGNFETIVKNIKNFLEPVISAIHKKKDFDKEWDCKTRKWCKS
jgi:predicted nucleotidyltransferase component of viral defense system